MGSMWKTLPQGPNLGNIDGFAAPLEATEGHAFEYSAVWLVASGSHLTSPAAGAA